MPRLLAFLLLCLAPAWACIATETRHGQSADGRYHLTVHYDDGFRHTMREGERELWSLHLGSLPDLIFVSSDGRHVVYQDDQKLELRDGRTGRLIRETRLTGVVLWLDAARAGWLNGGTLFLETEAERVVAWSLETGVWRYLERSELVQTVKRMDDADCALRLAAVHRILLPAGRVNSLRRRFPLHVAAYDLRLGDASAQDRLQAALKSFPYDATWSPLAHGLSCSLQTFSEGAPLWMLAASEEECLQALAAGGPQTAVAIRALGALRSRRALPALWARVGRDEHALYSVLQILEDEAAPELARRLPLLEDRSRDFNLACRFFQRVLCRAVVPDLVERVGPGRWEVVEALVFQTRLNLGGDAKKWKAWLSERHGQDRGAVLTAQGENSGMLWLARTRGEVSRVVSTPRLLGVFASHDTENASLRDGELRRLDGRADDDVLSWDVRTGQVTARLPKTYPDTAKLHQGEVGSTVLVDFGTSTQVWKNGNWRTIAGGVLHLSPDGRWASLIPSPGYLASQELLNVETLKKHPTTGLSDGEFTDDSAWLLGPLADLRGTAPRWYPSRPLMDKVLDVFPDGRQLVERNSVLEVVGADGKSQSLTRNYFALGEKARCSPDGELVVYNDDNQLHVVAADGRRLGECEAAGWSGFAIHPQSSAIAFQDASGLSLRALPSLKQGARLPQIGYLHSVRFSSDGRYLVAVESDQIRVYDLTPGTWSTEVPDPQLLSELWTGLRLQGGMATGLTPEQFWQRTERWRKLTGQPWATGAPALNPWPERLRQLQNLAATLLVVVLLGAWLRVQRRPSRLL